MIALLGALADGDALENIRPLEEPDRYFRVIVRNGKVYKNALPGENPVRARQSYRQTERVDPKGFGLAQQAQITGEADAGARGGHIDGSLVQRERQIIQRLGERVAGGQLCPPRAARPV